MEGDATIGTESSAGRRKADASCHCPGNEVWAVWVAPDHRFTAGLAARGAESAAKTEAPGSVVVERRLLCATTAGATEPGLELRLHECQNAGGENAAAAELAG